MSQVPHASENASQRRTLYGLNAAAMVIIGVVVLGFIFFFGYQSRGNPWASFDWTSSGANSLSGSTRQLLKQVSDGKQSYKIFSLYPSRSDIEKRDNRNITQDEHRQQVLDLLNEYARRSGKITVEDYGDRPSEDIQRQIRDLYAAELKPYQDVIDEHAPLLKKLDQFLNDQVTQIGAAAQKIGSAPKDIQNATNIQAQFRQMLDDLDSLKRAIKQESQKTLPRVGTLREMIEAGLTQGDVYNAFSLLTNPAQVKDLFPEPLAAYFIAHADEYNAMFSEITAYKDKLAKLKPLKMEDAIQGLSRNSVAILGADSAKVIPDYNIFTMAPGQNGTQGLATFNGEQAVSSALLAMFRPDKVKVVFVGLSARGGGGNFNDIKDILKDENFEPLDWAPPSPSPGGPPPDSAEPPAEGKGVVWIVFPPEADPQMAAMGMPSAGNPQPILEATKKHMAEGGQVLFLAEATVSNPALGAMGSNGFPYQELVTDFGIDVASKYTAVFLQETDDRDAGQKVTRTLPYMQLDHYEDHEITRPMQSLAAILGPSRSQGAPSFPTVVQLASSMPKDVDAKIIVKSPAGQDIWGESKFALDAKFDIESDMRAPLPLAVVSIKNKGQKDKDGKSLEQRVAVIGSKDFATDSWIETSQAAMIGGQLVAIPQFPGNSELMKNTILWLAGYENMISVSAKANQGARIGNVPTFQLALLRVVIALGIPLTALIIGGFVWMARRR